MSHICLEHILVSCPASEDHRQLTANQPAGSEHFVALSSKGNATKRLVSTVPILARTAAGHHILKMQVIISLHLGRSAPSMLHTLFE